MSHPESIVFISTAAGIPQTLVSAYDFSVFFIKPSLTKSKLSVYIVIRIPNCTKVVPNVELEARMDFPLLYVFGVYTP